MENNWLRRPRTWIELFVLLNLGGLAPDIFLAHSVNAFHSRAEYTPLIFSLAAPMVLLPAFWAMATGRLAIWRWLGFLVGGTAVLIGITGLVLHLQSQFFQQWTMASLVYAAPFAAPPRTTTPLNCDFNASTMCCKTSPSTRPRLLMMVGVPLMT